MGRGRGVWRRKLITRKNLGTFSTSWSNSKCVKNSQIVLYRLLHREKIDKIIFAGTNSRIARSFRGKFDAVTVTQPGSVRYKTSLKLEWRADRMTGAGSSWNSISNCGWTRCTGREPSSRIKKYKKGQLYVFAICVARIILINAYRVPRD